MSLLVITMSDYLYSIKPEYPVRETISFATDIAEYDSIIHPQIGSPVRFDIYSYNGTLMPAPQFPVEETTARESLVSALQSSKYEHRRAKYETAVRSYMLHFDLINNEERNTLVNFFLARKGRFDNFKILYPTMFGGAETLVRFNTDELAVTLKSFRRYEISIEVRQAVNGQYIPKWAGARREFAFAYRADDLSALKTWVKDVAKGRSEKFTLDVSQVIPYWTGTYVCRLKEDDVTESYDDISDKNSNIELIETI